MILKAKTLEEAYIKASKELGCSTKEVIQNSITIQNPSKGILGLFKKEAIIEVKIEKKVISKIEEVLKDLEPKLNSLLKKLCFNIKIKELKAITDDTIFLHLDGEDAALLIGKEGYRYHSFYYMIFNLVYQKYGFHLRLEIADFLQTQEKNLKSYLDDIIEEVKEKGTAKTMPLNGMFVYLALNYLREKLRDKYIAIKTNKFNEEYIVINNFLTKKDDE